jgi:hypothetical protein
MLAKCSNPECESPFNYREGRLVRYSRSLSNGEFAENQLLIEHFWLCGKCAGVYEVVYAQGIRAKIRPRNLELSEKSLPHFVSAA